MVTGLVEKVHGRENKRLRRAQSDKIDKDEAGSNEASEAQGRRSLNPQLKTPNTEGQRRRSEPAKQGAGKRNKRSSLRVQRTQLYKEVSSGDSLDESRSEEEREVESPTAELNKDKSSIPQEIIETVNGLIDSVLAAVKKTREISPMTRKIVHLRVFDEDQVSVITDHKNLISVGESVQDSPAKRSSSKKRLHSPSSETTVEIVKKSEQPVSSLNGVHETISSSRIQKRLHSDLSPRMVPDSKLKKRRSLSPGILLGTARRNIFPVDVKISAIRRLEAGEPHSSVATDLDISVNNLAKWWVGRKDIWDKFYHLNSNGDGLDFEAIDDAVGVDLPSASIKQSEVTPKVAPSPVVEEGSLVESRVVADRRSRSSSSETQSDFPLEIKSAALERVLAGETKSAVSRDLSIKPSDLARWWARRESILSDIKRENLLNSTQDKETDGAEETGETHGLEANPRQTQLKISRIESPEIQTNPLVHGEKKNNETTEVKRKAKKRRFNTKATENTLIKKKKKRPRSSSMESSVTSDSVIIVDVVDPDDTSFKFLEVVKENSSLPDAPRPRRLSVGVMNHASPTSTSRQVMPLDVKREAILKIVKGESQASVARDLDLSVSTVASWWRKKETIISTEELSTQINTENKATKPELGTTKLKEPEVKRKKELHPEVETNDTMVPFNISQEKDALLKSMKTAFSKAMNLLVNRSIDSAQETAVPAVKIIESNPTLGVESPINKEVKMHGSEVLMKERLPKVISNPSAGNNPVSDGSSEENKSLESSSVPLSQPSVEPTTVEAPRPKVTEPSSLAASATLSPARQRRAETPVIQPPSLPNKKKSLEFLANSLMKRALAHTAQDREHVKTPKEAPRPEQEERPGSLALGPEKKTGSLGLIADSYLSSEEES